MLNMPDLTTNGIGNLGNIGGNIGSNIGGNIGNNTNNPEYTVYSFSNNIAEFEKDEWHGITYSTDPTIGIIFSYQSNSAEYTFSSGNLQGTYAKYRFTGPTDVDSSKYKLVSITKELPTVGYRLQHYAVVNYGGVKSSCYWNYNQNTVINPDTDNNDYRLFIKVIDYIEIGSKTGAVISIKLQRLSNGGFYLYEDYNGSYTINGTLSLSFYLSYLRINAGANLSAGGIETFEINSGYPTLHKEDNKSTGIKNSNGSSTSFYSWKSDVETYDSTVNITVGSALTGTKKTAKVYCESSSKNANN